MAARERDHLWSKYDLISEYLKLNVISDARTLRICLSSFSYFVRKVEHINILNHTTCYLRPEQILSKFEEKERKNRKVKITLHRDFEDFVKKKLLIGKFFHE